MNQTFPFGFRYDEIGVGQTEYTGRGKYGKICVNSASLNYFQEYLRYGEAPKRMSHDAQTASDTFYWLGEHFGA